MTALDYRVLGPLEIRRDGELVSVPAPKQRALLGLLLLHANEPVSQDELIDQLWGDRAPRTARASLQNLVHALRRVLGRETLERRPGGYVLHVKAGELDLDRFEQLVSDARRAGPKERAVKLRDALELWRGPPLVEAPVEPFLQFEIARLEEWRLTALEDRVDAELELGLHEALVAELESLVERYPLRERIWGQLMLAHYRSGQQAEAVGAYRRAHATFVDELGVEPGVALRDLQRSILLQDAKLDDPGHRIGWTLERAAAVLPGDQHLRAESLYEYALALFRTGESRRGISTLEAAMRMAAAVDDRSVEERARLHLSYLAMWTEGKSVDEFLSEVEFAVERFDRLGDHKSLAVALRLQYQHLTGLGRADESVTFARRAAELAAERGDSYEEAAALMSLGQALSYGSTPVDRAIVECESMLEDGERRGIWCPPPLPLRLLLALGLLYAQAGRLEDARTTLTRTLDLARDDGLLWYVIGTELNRGDVELIVGDPAAAAEHYRSAYALIDTEEDRLTKPEIAASLGCALAQLQRLEEARTLAHIAEASKSGHWSTEALWRRALALVQAQESQFAEAIRLSDEARVRSDATDWLTFRGETLEDAAFVHRLAGDVERESGALEEALILYERKGNVVGAERVRRQLARP